MEVKPNEDSQSGAKRLIGQQTHSKVLSADH